MDIPRTEPQTGEPAVATVDGGELQLASPITAQAIERATVSEQVATAHAYPRNMEKFKRSALAMVTLDVETAEACHYCVPVGKERDEATGRWVEKFAEGPSIRAAEIVAAAYENLRVKAFIVSQTERMVTCEGQAWDMEKNYAAAVQATEVTVITKGPSAGQPYSERQRSRAAKGLMSKVYRDALFKVVPRALCKTILDEAKKVAAKTVRSLEERRKRAASWVSTLKIENAEARVFARMEVSGWSDMNDEHLQQLTGMKTAITDGDLPIDEAFPPVEVKEQKLPTHPGDTGKPTDSAKTPQKPPGKKEAAKTPPEKKDAAEPPKQEQAPPQKKESGPAEGESFDAASPVKPEAKQEPAATADSPAQPPAEAASNYTPPAQWESDEPMSVIKDIEGLCKGFGVSSVQLKSYLMKIRVMKPNQKTLSDLAGSKLLDIRRTFVRMAPEIKKEPA